MASVLRAIGIAATALVAMPMAVAVAAPGDPCAQLGTGRVVAEAGQVAVTVTAPEGSLIDQYCVVGADQQPVYVDLDPLVAAVTVEAADGSMLTEYSVSFVLAPPEPAEESESTAAPGDTLVTAPPQAATVTPPQHAAAPAAVHAGERPDGPTPLLPWTLLAAGVPAAIGATIRLTGHGLRMTG